MQPQQSKKCFFLPSNPSPNFVFQMYMKFSNQGLFIKVLLDTKAFACFIDKDFASYYNLVFIKKNHLEHVEAIDDRPLALTNVNEETESLKVVLENQVSRIVFNIIKCPSNLVILGLSCFEFL